MSEYICALTQQPATSPVVSIKSGHIFEKSAIEQHLETETTCPVTNQPLTKDDLIPLKINKPTAQKSKNNTDISNMVSVFQNEWDNIMLESFTLKQNLEIVRKELSHALYQYDAASRTIARLLREKEESKGALADLTARKNQAKREMATVPAGGAKEFPEKMIRDIYDKRIELSKLRQDRERDEKIMLTYSSQEMILNYKLTTSVPLHSEKNPGVNCLDINTDLDDLLITGGQDGTVVLYNRAQDKIINTFDKHSKPVTGVKFIPVRAREGRQVLAISASEDCTGYSFVHNNETGELTVSYKYEGHSGALTGCLVHPINYLGIFGSRDGSFSCHDLAQGRFLTSATLENKAPIRTMGLHPDGEIGAFAGDDGIVRIWNIPQLTQIGQIQAHKGAIDSLSFSEDGKQIATSSFQDRMIKLWDLRKLGDDNYRILNDDIEGVVSFDKSGKFLAVGTSPSLLLYNARTTEQFTKINAHSDRITAIQFGNHSKYIATVSKDRHLNIFS